MKKDLHEPFLRYVWGLEFAREARGKSSVKVWVGSERANVAKLEGGAVGINIKVIILAEFIVIQ